MEFFGFLSILGYCFAFKRFLRLRIESTTLLILSFIVSISYIAAYLHVLKMIAMILQLLGGLFFLTTPFYIKKGKFLQDYLTPGFTFVVLTTFLFIFLATKIIPMNWDGNTHWVPLAKLLFHNYGFVNSTDIVGHKSYPPGGALFIYFFMQLFHHFKFSGVYIAQAVFQILPLTLLFQEARWLNWKSVLGSWFFVLLVLITVFKLQTGLFGDSDMDHLAGIYFGLTILFYYRNCSSVYSILYLIPVTMTFILLKMKLYPLVMLAIIVLVLFEFYRKIIYEKKSELTIFNKIKGLLLLLLVLILAMFTSYSWHCYLRHISVPIEWKLHGSSTLMMFKSIFSSSSISPFQQQVRTTFFSYMPGLISRSYRLIFIIVLFMLFISFLKKRRRIFIELLLMHGVLFIGAIGYSLGLLLMYMYSFSHVEALYLASINRYSNIYALGWFLVIFSQTFQFFILENSIDWQCKDRMNWWLFRWLISWLLLIFLAYHIIILLISGYKNYQISFSDRARRKTYFNILSAYNNYMIRFKDNANVFVFVEDGDGLVNRIAQISFAGHAPLVWIGSLSKVTTKKLVKQKIKYHKYMLLIDVPKSSYVEWSKILHVNLNRNKPFLIYTLCNIKTCHKSAAFLFSIDKNKGSVKLNNMVKKTKLLKNEYIR